MPDAVDQLNLRQTEMLNQRGGRALSMVDLMRAGTLTPEMAAFALCAVSGGASILTAARPSGAGKTTLMAALLAFLPPGEKLRTVGTGASRVPRGHSDHGRECLLCHEIGSGPYFGYLWGAEARAYFRAQRRGVRIWTNIHADDIDDLRDELSRPALGVEEDDYRQIGLVAFMHMSRSTRGPKRRVSSLYGAVNGGHELLWEWEPETDSYQWRGRETGAAECVAGAPVAYDQACEFLRDLAETGPSEYARTRQAIREFLVGQARHN